MKDERTISFEPKVVLAAYRAALSIVRRSGQDATVILAVAAIIIDTYASAADEDLETILENVLKFVDAFHKARALAESEAT